MTKPTSVQWIFSPTPGSLKLAPKGLCMLIIIRHLICGIFFYQSRYERCMSIKDITQIMYILFIKINNSINWRLDKASIFEI